MYDPAHTSPAVVAQREEFFRWYSFQFAQRVDDVAFEVGCSLDGVAVSTTKRFGYDFVDYIQ